MIGAELDAYAIRSELGSGGMGTVYLAESADGRPVAVKVVHPHLIATPGFFKRFLREAEVGKQVKHENVVATLDVDATLHEGQQVNYMVMEYVEGRSLRKLLQNLETVPEALLRAVAVQMAAGLAAIHAQCLVGFRVGELHRLLEHVALFDALAEAALRGALAHQHLAALLVGQQLLRRSATRSNASIRGSSRPDGVANVRVDSSSLFARSRGLLICR